MSRGRAFRAAAALAAALAAGVAQASAAPSEGSGAAAARAQAEADAAPPSPKETPKDSAKARPREAAPKRNRCAELDAASIPACADRLARGGSQPPVAAPLASGPAAPQAQPVPARAPVAAHRSPVRAAKPRPAAPQPTTVWGRAMDQVRKQPILAGAGGGAALLLLALGAWGAAGRIRPRRRPSLPPQTLRQPPATPPSAYRRDVLLRDAAGRDWRIGGGALTPGAAVGCGSSSDLRVEGDGVAERHALLWVSEGRLLLRGLAADPVLLNDRRLRAEEAEIASTGDSLQLGQARFTIIID
ncbi:FHA domain-containing protein [Phenylobacterium sp.]|jgi:hypothetical protein|uniref:FHA domain-containing protein n=1 Tax=Phenylobacterium sp. TaxID=1871053 RepID=UPI002F40DC2E